MCHCFDKICTDSSRSIIIEWSINKNFTLYTDQKLEWSVLSTRLSICYGRKLNINRMFLVYGRPFKLLVFVSSSELLKTNYFCSFFLVLYREICKMTDEYVIFKVLLVAYNMYRDRVLSRVYSPFSSLFLHSRIQYFYEF